MNAMRHQPVRLLAIAHAVLAVVLAFHLVTMTAEQLAAVEGLFAALGFTAASSVTPNARLDDETVAKAKASVDWRGRLTDDPPPSDDDV